MKMAARAGGQQRRLTAFGDQSTCRNAAPSRDAGLDLCIREQDSLMSLKMVATLSAHIHVQ
jgi:hypothetical protein